MDADAQDLLKRSYAALTALKARTSDGLVHEKYVHEYHRVLDNLATVGINVDEFRISQSELKRAFASSNYETGEIEYYDYKEVEGDFFTYKLESLISYFTLSSPDSPKKKIGFGQS